MPRCAQHATDVVQHRSFRVAVEPDTKKRRQTQHSHAHTHNTCTPRMKIRSMPRNPLKTRFLNCSDFVSWQGQATYILESGFFYSLIHPSIHPSVRACVRTYIRVNIFNAHTRNDICSRFRAPFLPPHPWTWYPFSPVILFISSSLLCC